MRLVDFRWLMAFQSVRLFTPDSSTGLLINSLIFHHSSCSYRWPLIVCWDIPGVIYKMHNARMSFLFCCYNFCFFSSSSMSNNMSMSSWDRMLTKQTIGSLVQAGYAWAYVCNLFPGQDGRIVMNHNKPPVAPHSFRLFFTQIKDWCAVVTSSLSFVVNASITWYVGWYIHVLMYVHVILYMYNPYSQ